MNDSLFAGPTLFQPDIFSKAGPVYAQTSVERRHSIVSVFHDHYFPIAPKTTFISCIGGNEINSMNFKIDIGTESYIIKRMPETASQRLASIAELHRMLCEKKIPVPQVVQGRNGEACVCDGTDCWLLMKYVEGQFFDGSTLMQVFKVAECFNELSAALRTLPPSLAPQGQIDIHQGDEGDLWNEFKTGKSNWDTVFGSDISAALTAEFSRLEAAVSDNGFLEHDPIFSEMVLIHMDWHPHNILVDRNDAIHVLDVDSINMMNPSIAAAFGAYKILRQFVVVNRNEPVVAAEGIRRYCERLESFNMTKDDFFHFSAVEILRRIFIIMRLTYRNNNLDWNFVLPMHLAALEETKNIFDCLPG